MTPAFSLFPFLVFADAQVIEELPQPVGERICIGGLTTCGKPAHYLFVPLSVGQQPMLQFINRKRCFFL